MRQMTAIELRDFLATGVATVQIDVREDIELEFGMLEDAVHIPMQSVPGQLNVLEKHKNDTVIVICRSGKRSDQIGQFLEQMGFSDIINLAGGMNSWATDVDTSMTVY
ncbi:MAG: rhodanese-like domain-containing protein [Methylophaga sp.]|nr:rhodanese-like domain-containing protein [Methylophaga sp.]